MSAVAMSWREFRFNLRPIVLLAFGGVIFSTLAIAAALHWLLGFPWLWASFSAPSCRRRTPWRRSPSRGACIFRGASW